MFNKTRIRLTLLNAVVLFVILICFGLIIYTYLRHQLYQEVDHTLAERVGSFQPGASKPSVFYIKKSGPPPSPLPLVKSLVRKSIDPNIFMILWDAKGKPIPLITSTGDEKSDVMKLGRFRSASPQTVEIGGHVYRTITKTFSRPRELNIMYSTQVLNKLDGSASKGIVMSSKKITAQIAAVQAVTNIDSEQNMLYSLLRLIGIGILLGAAVAFLAGLYLANQSLRPIRRSWEKQRQFVADASHEMRMPLSIIRANAERVFRHPDASILAMSEPISMVIDESKRMSKLTEQLLILARSDSDQEEILLRPVLIGPLLHEAADKFAMFAEMNKVRLELGGFPGLAIKGDREKLIQLFMILLDNSLKHTPANGGIRIDVHKKGSHAEIVVADTGSGILPEDLPHIFDRFYRGDKMRSRASGGTGLGLAIARWIVEKHGGTIRAESEPDKGTVMTIHLPAVLNNG